MNNFTFITILFLCFSCQNEYDILKNQNNYLISEINLENTYDAIEFETKIHSKQVIWHYYKPVKDMATNYYEYDSALTSNKHWNRQKLFNFRNNLLHNIADYSEGEHQYRIDTVSLDFSNVNLNDTALVTSIITTTNLLAQTLNPSQIVLQLSSFNRKGILQKYNRLTYCGFTKLDRKVKYSNKLFFKNEKAYIIPGIFEIDDYKDAQIQIFKENSIDFIMENGEKKTFTNPISLKASTKKGIHTLKGIIMITKYKNELVPKPFEFRYMVK